MAYDEAIAARIRALLDGEPGVTERRMFGGLAFLVDGNMAIAASSEGGVLVRADPAASDAMADSTVAEPAVMRGRPMSGWLTVSGEHLATGAAVAPWVELGVGYARTLPAKGA
jgi:TfoX/Sxy family transcriptional regulator of competence genes